MRRQNMDSDIVLIAYEGTVGPEIAVALEVQRTEILCGIASRVMRNLTNAPSGAEARRRMVKGGERIER